MPSRVSPQDPWVQVSEIVQLIRNGRAQTRPELADATRLGRNVITQRVQTAQELGLLRPSGNQRSRGGRAAEVWEFNGALGRILVGVLDHRCLRVALTDLDHRVVAHRHIAWDTPTHERGALERMAAEMDEVLRRHHPEGPAWGVGIGVVGAVDPVTGRALPGVLAEPSGGERPPDPHLRAWLTRRLRTPVWVESIPNLAALGVAARPRATPHDPPPDDRAPGESAPDEPGPDLVYVRMGRTVATGILSGGRAHRGADRIAGALGHVDVSGGGGDAPVCRCGRAGCLDAYAARWALEEAAARAVAAGTSPFLAALPTPVTATDVAAGAAAADPVCAELVVRAARATGRAVADMVTWFNPRTVVVGGEDLATSDLFRGTLARTLHERTPPSIMRRLELGHGRPDRHEEIVGASVRVVAALLSPDYLAEWAPAGFPVDTDRLLAKHPG